MDLELRLREAVKEQDPGQAFTAKVMAGVDGAKVIDIRSRMRRRIILPVALLVVGAAAAMFVLEPPGTESTLLDPVQVGPPVMRSVYREISPAEPEVGTGEPAHPATTATTDPVVAAAGSPAIMVLLMPVSYDSQDGAARPAIDAFYSSLLRALRSMRNVDVEVAAARTADDQRANRITVVSPRITEVASGGRVHHSGDGRSTWGISVGPNRGWAVEVMLKSASQKKAGNTATVNQYIDGNGTPTGEFCDAKLNSQNPAASSFVQDPVNRHLPTGVCASIESLAAWLVAALRPQSAPQVADTAWIASRLTDTSTYDRPEAFQALLDRAREDGNVLDAAAIDAITAYIGSLPPAQRRFSLISLQGLREPTLVAPLLGFLQRDEDESVRLEALAVLVWNHGSDARVRAALQAVALHDASRLVRMVAQRTLHGDAQWQAYVVSTLADVSLRSADRLAPALYDARQYPGGLQNIPSYLGSEPSTRQLLDIFQQVRSDTRQTDTGVMQSVLFLLTLTKPSAAIDLRISILRESPPPPSWLAMNSLNALLDEREDPRVREFLGDVTAGKEGPELRNMLERTRR